MSKNIRSELWFTRLELENFRQYFGSHIINFSTDSSKHLTVVHAENSVGKTTMLNAMKWCLYGVTPEFKDTVNLVCDKSDKNTCRVRLNFNYGDIEYTALRVYDQKSRKSKLSLSTIDNKSRHQLPVTGSPEAEINNILPSELSNYFLFAGERYSQALDEANNTSHIKAIRDILGFTMSESVIEDIEKLKKKNERKLTDLLSKDNDNEELKEELEKLLGEKDDYDLLKKELQDALNDQEEIKKENLQKIIDSDDKKAKNLGIAKSKLDVQRNQSVVQRDNFLKKKIKLISDYGYILFSAKLTSKNFDHIKVNHSSLPSPLADHFINKLISEEKCICGTPVTPKSNELKKLIEVRDSASTKIIQNRVLDAISQGDGFRKDSKAFMKNLRDIEGSLKTHNTQIGTIDKELIKIKSAIEDIGDVDVTEYQTKLNAAEEAIRGIHRQQGSLISSINDNKTQISTLKTRIKQSKINPKETKKLEDFDSLCTSLIKRLNTYLKNHEAKSINDIKDLVQTNIDESLRKGKKVILSPDYKFELMDKVTKRIDQGADGGNGQTLLANLSFISALISTSKDRAKDTEKSIFVPGTIAPFVIDAPFAEMDKSYRLNTFEFLPKQSHQLIIFLSTGQWQDAYEDIIGKYIGKRYLLVNHDMTNNFSENTITIKNKTHQLNVKSNDSSMSATTIEEI